jgi:hypothetical protein
MKKRAVSAMMVLVVIFTLLAGCQRVSAAQNTAAPTEIPAVQTGMLNFGLQEALNAVRQTIQLDYSKYSIHLISDQLKYDGQDYYQFRISNSSGSIGPSIIVSRENGALYCYYPDHTVTGVDQDKVFGSKC